MNPMCWTESAPETVQPQSGSSGITFVTLVSGQKQEVQ
jgi:hypothetical protein